MAAPKSPADPPVIRALRRACKAAGGQKHWAALHGLSPTQVSLALTGARPVSDHMARLVGFSRVVVYKAVKPAKL